MDRATQLNIEPAAIPHPGEMVQEYLEKLGWTQRDLARRTDLTPKTISEICNGKTPITPTTALAFEKVLQRPAHLWLNFQRQYDEAQARLRESQRSILWADWVKRFPLREMKERGFAVPTGRSETESLLRFFGVASPESWKTLWGSYAVSYRQTRASRIREESVAAWVREVEIQASEFNLRDFDEGKLFSSLRPLKRLSREKVNEQTLGAVQEICSACGIAVVFVPELPNTGISGCARWLNEKNAVVGLSFRYKKDDQLWFTFFHELGHIVLHRNKKAFVLDNAAEDIFDRIIDPEMQQYESEANQFSADTLIPPTALAEFLRHKVFTNDSIHEFADRLGIGPGILVGRLQREQVLKHHQGNALKQSIEWGLKQED